MYFLEKMYFFTWDFPLFEYFKCGPLTLGGTWRVGGSDGGAAIFQMEGGPPMRGPPLAPQQNPCGDMVTDLHDNMSSKSNYYMSSNGIFFWGEVDKHIPPKRQLLRWAITSESASNTISKSLEPTKKIVWYVFSLDIASF